MYVDICFPNRNEKEFLQRAKSLSISGLCFIYEDKKNINLAKIIAEESGVSIYYGLLNKKNNLIEKVELASGNRLNARKDFPTYIYLLDIGFLITTKITQVTIKELASKRYILGLPFSKIVKVLSEDSIEKTRRFIRLCEKYKVRLCFSSFAFSPEELLPKKEICSLGSVLGARQSKIKDSINSLSYTFNKATFP